MKLSFLKTTLILTAATISTGTSHTASYADLLRDWEQELIRERDAIHAKFDLKAARKEQKKAFEDHGALWATRYTSSWGGGIYMDWVTAKKLHESLLRTIRQTAIANRGDSPVSLATMTKLREQMVDFRWRNKKIRNLLIARLKINAYSGKELGIANDYRLKAIAARTAGDKPTAAAMETRAKEHHSLANKWLAYAGNISRMTRMLSGPLPADRSKFMKSYIGHMKLAKSGKLPEETVAKNKQ